MINTVVIKSIRACNLRCPYCYYINEDTPDYGKVISKDTVRALYERVSHYLQGQGIFTFIWHGGEPLMLGIKRFQEFIDLQADYFAPGQVDNLVQTNGVLVNRDWIEFFLKNNVFAGISMDGDRATHDRNRPAINGKGTYERVLDAIRLFHENRIPVALLCVVDPDADGYETLRHIESLRVVAVDFLIPMANNALQKKADNGDNQYYTDFRKVGVFLRGAFRRWTEAGEYKMEIRLFENLIRNAFGIRHGYLNAGPTNLSENVIMETTGEICLDTDFWYVDRFGFGDRYGTKFNVHDPDFIFSTVQDYVEAVIHENRLDQLPDPCQRCKVRSLCHASHPASRFDADGSFNHRSAYCETLAPLCGDVLDYIVMSGHQDELFDEDLKRVLKSA